MSIWEKGARHSRLARGNPNRGRYPTEIENGKEKVKENLGTSTGGATGARAGQHRVVALEKRLGRDEGEGWQLAKVDWRPGPF